MRSTGRKLQREPMTPQLPPIGFGSHLKQHGVLQHCLELYIIGFSIVLGICCQQLQLHVFISLFHFDALFFTGAYLFSWYSSVGAVQLVNSIGTLQLVQFNW